MQHAGIGSTPPLDSELNSVRAALETELDALLRDLRQAPALQARVAELEQIRHQEFDRGGGWKGRSPEGVAAFYAKTGRQQQEILDIQKQCRRTVERARDLGARVRQYVVDLVFEIAAAAPLLNSTDQLVREFGSSSVAPDAFLVGLRGILRQSRQTSGAPSIPEEIQQEQIKGHASSIPESTASTARKRERGPDLETSRRRIELWDRLASELATIFKQVRRFATVPMLKAKYPDFAIWELLSEAEQAELLKGDFKPRAYAGNLVLRQNGLTSLETLRKDRQKLRHARK